MIILRRVFNKIVWEYNRFRGYIFPNITLIMRNKLKSNLWNVKIYQDVFMYGKGGNYNVGDYVQFGYDIGGRNRRGYCELQARSLNSQIIIGDYTAINNNCCFISNSRIKIGKQCRIGINCNIMDFDGHSIDPHKRNEVGKIEEIIIGNNVCILAGTIIGDNSVIAAGAVVKGKFRENVLIAGVPAKIIRDI